MDSGQNKTSDFHYTVHCFMWVDFVPYSITQSNIGHILNANWLVEKLFFLRSCSFREMVYKVN